MRILITGAAGYVGALLVERFTRLPEVTLVVATDRSSRDKQLGADPADKLIDERGRLENLEFVKSLDRHLPLNAVVHAGFSVRAGYGKRAAEVERANLDGCRNVFEFCFRNDIERLIYFSSAAAYGARPGNKLDHFFTEDEPLREETYPYGAQKRRSEEMLRQLYDASRRTTRVAIVRPCSITGPRFLTERTKKITLIAFLKKLLPVIPKLSDDWARQYIHEEDLVEAIKLLLAADMGNSFESFNLAPSDYLTASDIAQTLGKRTVRLPAWLMDLGFTTLWHATRGRVPTPPGSVNFYRHPINLDGRKITRLGFRYRYDSRQCLLTA